VADLFNRAMAFLMAGVATDYTEVKVLKCTTRSRMLALFLSVVTLPQIAIYAVLMNMV